MHRPPKKMKHDIEMKKTVNLTFKLDILYSNMHKYKVDRMETHYIQYFDSTSSAGYNNLTYVIQKVLVLEKEQYDM